MQHVPLTSLLHICLQAGYGRREAGQPCTLCRCVTGPPPLSNSIIKAFGALFVSNGRVQDLGQLRVQNCKLKHLCTDYRIGTYWPGPPDSPSQSSPSAQAVSDCLKCDDLSEGGDYTTLTTGATSAAQCVCEPG